MNELHLKYKQETGNSSVSIEFEKGEQDTLEYVVLKRKDIEMFFDEAEDIVLHTPQYIEWLEKKISDLETQIKESEREKTGTTDLFERSAYQLR